MNYLQTRSQEQNEKHISHYNNIYEVSENAHAIAILTEWDEFKECDWQKIYNNMLKPAFIFDGRNLLNSQKMKEIGFNYQAIGS